MPDDQPDDRRRAALKLWVVMNRAAHSVEDRLRAQVEAHDLSLTEFAVLEVLHTRGALPIGEVGERILRTSGSMTYVVDKLEERGLIERCPCPEDRRVLHAALTPEGRRTIETVFPEHAALIDELMRPLALDEQHAAAEMLKRVGLNAARHGRDA